MSCKDAMIPSVITFSPEQTVGEALETLQQYEVRTAPIVDADPGSDVPRRVHRDHRDLAEPLGEQAADRGLREEPFVRE